MLPTIDIRALSVPFEATLKVATGPIDEDAVSRLEQRGFDQAPVLEGEVCIGTIPTPRLRALRLR